MRKIFIIGQGFHEGQWYAEAIAEDGTSLYETSTEFAINLPWAMGVTLTSTMAHRKYKAYYPDGFDLVDMLGLSEDVRSKDPMYCTAMMLNEGGDAKHFAPDE